jgi:hypothetical protein
MRFFRSDAMTSFLRKFGCIGGTELTRVYCDVKLEGDERPRSPPGSFLCHLVGAACLHGFATSPGDHGHFGRGPHDRENDQELTR